MNDQDKIAYQAEIARLHLVLAERQAKIGQLMGEAARAGIEGAPVRGAGEVPSSLLIRAYNSGYKSGHHDTVEAQYTDIDQRDMFTYHADVVADMIADGTLAAPAAPAKQAEPSLRAALERIARWHGEFPEVTCSDGTVTGYGAAYGSNGQRDYMRQVASDALTAAPAAPLPEQTGPSIGDDPEFIGRVIAAASAVMDGDTSGEWQRFAAYIDSRSAASTLPAPAQPNSQAPSINTENFLDIFLRWGDGPWMTESPYFVELVAHINAEIAIYHDAWISAFGIAKGWQAKAEAAGAAPAQQQEPRIAVLEARLTAIAKWLEQNQSDVFRRGLWDVVSAITSESIETAAPGASIGDKQ